MHEKYFFKMSRIAVFQNECFYIHETRISINRTSSLEIKLGFLIGYRIYKLYKKKWTWFFYL